ncbi:ABC transporter permease [Shimazuella sp. AN120528]|uniref:ABC transporter permease n=1 Tax=Shimazuella soli TaxID=1892854 RepID=UPI001F0E60ED|nr:ABC transporter permease [Shimazuella soli]MCH5586266.1 ABC transporter permease [Shimazuella soli]
MFLAIREIWYSKLRYFLIGLIMVLITWLVFMVAGLANGLSADNASAIDRMNADYFVMQKDAEGKLNRSQISKIQWKGVSQQTKDKNATPIGMKMTSVLKLGTTKKMDITAFAVDINGFIAPKVIVGSSIKFLAKGEIVIDQSLEQEGIRIGDWMVDSNSEKKWKVVGYTTNNSYSHSPVIYMNQATWIDWTKQDSYNAVVLRGMESQKIKLNKELELVSKKRVLQSTPGYKEEQGSLEMMIAFLFIIASFIQAVFFYVITLQKSHQFGVLKAIGATTKYLVRSVVGQIIVIASISVLVSIGFTYATSLILPDSVPFILEKSTFAGFSVLMIMVSLLGALLSIYQITKVEAIDAIGRVE